MSFSLAAARSVSLRLSNRSPFGLGQRALLLFREGMARLAAADVLGVDPNVGAAVDGAEGEAVALGIEHDDREALLAADPLERIESYKPDAIQAPALTLVEQVHSL